MKAARVAYEQVMSARHPGMPSKAAYSLGIVLSRAGDKAGARAAYQQAIDSGHKGAAPKAAYHLGNLLADHGGRRPRSARCLSAGCRVRS